MKNLSKWSLLLATCILCISGCKDDDGPTTGPNVAIIEGDTEAVGANGTLKTWARTTNGIVDQVGITIDGAAYDIITATPQATMHMMDLPAVVSTQTGIKHATIDWNPAGSDPDPVYNAPRFDFHYFLIGHSEMTTIPAGDDPTPINSDLVPVGYEAVPMAAAPVSMAGKGVHYVDKTAPEFNGGSFSKSFVYGFSAGNHVFLEPMVSKAAFDSHSEIVEEIRQPVAFQRTGISYPTRYTVRHEASANLYHVILEGFVER